MTGAGPFAEDKWEEILIGTNSSNIKLVSKCSRCLVCFMIFRLSYTYSLAGVLPCVYIYMFQLPHSLTLPLVQLPNVCTETGIRDNAVPYKVLMKFRTGMDPQGKMKPYLGCNGVPSGEGVLRVGDVVSVTKMTSVE